MVTVRSHVRAQIAWLAMIDLACLVVGSIVGVLVRLGPEEMVYYVYDHIDGWLLFYGGVILANYLVGSYRVQYTFSRFNLIVTWMFSILFALLILSITSYAWFVMVLGRGVLFLSIIVYSILSLSMKLLVYRSLFRSERFTCRTAIIGTGCRAENCRRILEREYVLPAHKVVAFILLNPGIGVFGIQGRPLQVVAHFTSTFSLFTTSSFSK
jgi:FlaA1/EpsC-like NDP-sugar epimerase